MKIIRFLRKRWIENNFCISIFILSFFILSLIPAASARCGILEDTAFRMESLPGAGPMMKKTGRKDGLYGPGPGAKRRPLLFKDLPADAREKIAGRLERAEQAVAWTDETPLAGVPGAFRAFNRLQGLTAYFTEKGLTLLPAGRGEPAWRLGMTLLGCRREGVLRPAAKGTIEVSGNRVEYRRDLLTEWYLNDRRGLEQCLTIARRPAGKETAPLSIEWTVSGPLSPGLEKDESSLVFSRSGAPVLRYGGLKAWDATGRPLPARLAVYKGKDAGAPIRVAWVVEDAGADYPVTVDPVFGQVQKISASDGATADEFGYSVSLSGPIAVIGAPCHNADQGAAYIFYRDRGGPENWGELKKLVASDGAAGDYFGDFVSLNGDMVLIGAPGHNFAQGAAYVFYRDRGGADNWGQLKKLEATGGVAGDEFGFSVSLTSDKAVVGAPYHNADQGAAYIFYRDKGGADNWGQLKKLEALGGAADDGFGVSVSLTGDKAVVGAPGHNTDQGAAHVFYRDRGGAHNWGELKKLEASDGAAGDEFGYAVSLERDTAVVGAPAASLAGPEQGAAYVFAQDKGGANNWGQTKKLVASDGKLVDHFGLSVSVTGDTALIGTWQIPIFFTNKGAAYLFSRNNGGANNWGELKKLEASDGAVGDFFGASVCLSGDGVVIGAPNAGVAAPNQGAAYVYAGDRFILTVQKDGEGGGTITSSPPGIDCGGDCMAECAQGSGYILTGEPNEGSALDGWSGVDCPGNGPCLVTMTQDFTVTATFNPDSDGDGVSDGVENAGPHGGDANHDGILDSLQADVATFQDIYGVWCTLVAETGTTLRRVAATVNPSPGDAPEGISFPNGFFGFNVVGLTPGGSTMVTLTIHNIIDQLGYYRYGPTPDDNTVHWYDFSFREGTGAKGSRDQNQTWFEFYFTDGQRGDDDLEANGVIVDLGGPSLVGGSGGGGGGGSCFISSGN